MTTPETPQYFSIILELMKKVDFVINDFISTGFQNVANYMQAPVAVACILLIVLLGYGIMCGFIEMSVKTLNKTALTIGSVYVLCFGYAEFSSIFIDVFLHVASEISGVVVQGKLGELASQLLPGTNQGSELEASLQTVLIESVKVGGLVAKKGGFTDILPYIIGFSFMGLGTIVVGLAVVELIIAKLYLAMLLAVAPFFIACLLFPQTKSLFDGWLTQLKGFSIALILIGACVAICMNFLHWSVYGFYIQRAANVTLYSVVPLTLMSILCVLLLVGVIPIAKQIGGSSGGSGWSAIGGAMGAMAGNAMSTGLKTANGAVGAAKVGQKLSKHLGPNGKAGAWLAEKGVSAGKSALQHSKQLYQNIRNLSQKGGK